MLNFAPSVNQPWDHVLPFNIEKVRPCSGEFSPASLDPFGPTGVGRFVPGLQQVPVDMECTVEHADDIDRLRVFDQVGDAIMSVE